MTDTLMKLALIGLISTGLVACSKSEPEAAAQTTLPAVQPSSTPPSAQSAATVSGQEVTLGASKTQVLAGIEDWVTTMQAAPLHDGQSRLMGQFDKEKVIGFVELIGRNPEQPRKVSLSLFMPNDSPVHLLGNITVYGAVTKNLFPEWNGKERLDWFTKSVTKLTKKKSKPEGDPPSISRVENGKQIRVTVLKELGMVSVEIEPI
ncbi:hypothetical protein [Chromobacterium piscinae]|uniref:hypothetical protein n=1 Tax=Chromobacterium piscinae TaxID=686831 RepID=UPI003207ACBA